MRTSVLLLGLVVLFSSGGCSPEPEASISSAEGDPDRPTSFSSSHDWPQYLGPLRNGVSEENDWNPTFPDSGPRVLWRKRKIGTGFSSFAVEGEDLYTMGSDGENDILYCFSRTTGKEQWSYTYPCQLFSRQHEGGPACTPAVDEQGVYILSREGLFQKISRQTGKPVWSLEIPGTMGAQPPYFGFTCSPLLDGEQVYLDVGALLAFDTSDGKLLWVSTGFWPAYSSPVAFESFGVPLLAGFNGYGLTIANRKNGREVYRFRWETFTDINAVVPVVHGNRLFISSGYHTGGAVVRLASETVLASRENIGDATVHLTSVTDETASVPDRVWRNKEMSNHYSNSVLFRGHLYGFDEATVKCIRFDDGEPCWEKEGFGKGALFIAGDRLIILSDRGELAIARATPERYEEISRAHILGGKCWTVPVLVNGLLYARNARGDVVCLDLRKRV